MGLFGTIVGGLKSAVGGFIHGGPLGAIKGEAAFLKSKLGGTTPSISTTFPGARTMIMPQGPGGFDTAKLGGGLPQVPTPGFFHGTLSRVLPGGESGYSAAPPGYHLNKRYLAFYRAQQMGHVRQDPTTASQVVNVVVKNRHMNPLNPRALARANARQHAAVRMMRHALRGSGYVITRSQFRIKGARRKR